MAFSSRKLQAPLFLAVALLFLVFFTRGPAARPAPGSSGGHMPQYAAPTSVRERSGSAGPGMVMEDHDESEATRECEGGEDREECLTRRTLVAHTDYIYTQGNHN